MTAGEIAASGFQRQVVHNLSRNFQTDDDLGELKGAVGDIGVFINGERFFRFGGGIVDLVGAGDFPVAMLLQLRRGGNAFFLDSPALWRFKGMLQDALQDSLNGRTRLDVPDYFRVLFRELTKKYSGDIPFPAVYRRLTEEVMGGRIVLDQIGRLMFAETGKGVFPLSRTAMGVTNLGILALLLERKLVDKGAFLFIDEPESNLHPAWQVEMVRALFDLARGGVNVVMATHSADFMERLRALAARHPEAEGIIALNHFSPEGVNVRGEKSFRERMGDILEELTEEFAESYMGRVAPETEGEAGR